MPKIIFVQPFTVNAALAEQCEGRTVVLDVAFNAGSPAGKGTPGEQFQNTTKAFINALGDKLALWLDHHPHKEWANYKEKFPFVLVNREQAPACPPLINELLVSQYGAADTIVAHGDFDGIMSAIKYLNHGREAYIGMDADSIAADSRVGDLSTQGKHYEAALKATLADDGVRQALVAMFVYNSQRSHDIVNQAAEKYAAIQQETQRLSGLFEVSGKVAFIDTTKETKPFDLTALLLAGQKTAQVAVVRNLQRGNAQITVAGPDTWDFRPLSSLPGGMKNRVNLPDGDVVSIIDTINQ